MFTDATRVVINNKEVQSITTSNGGVIYTAHEPYHCFYYVEHPFELTITDLTTGQILPVTTGEHTFCLLEIGHTYKFKATDMYTEWFIEETITYQGEGYYELIILKRDIDLIFIEGKFTGITINATKNIIQTQETTDITANVKINAQPVTDRIVFFYKKLTPTITVNANPDTIQTNETTEIYSTLTNKNGSKIPNEKIHFYEKQ